MYIVWRRKPITTDRPVDLFVEYDTWNGVCERDISDVVSAWKLPPLRCSHAGPGRVARTPLLVYARRVGGRPRQELLDRLPTLRSCCMKDAFLLAAWWRAVEERMTAWENGDGVEYRFLARDKGAILTKLRQVAPRPSRAGRAAFTAFRLKKEAEAEQFWEDAFDQLRGSAWWQVLGVSPTATEKETRAVYHRLVMQHHPDRGGDAKTFMRVKEAYEAACRRFRAYS